MRLISILFLLMFALSAQAEVYRWVDADGVVHYTDTPPSKTAQPVKLPKLQTYQPGAAHDPFGDQAPTDGKTPPPASAPPAPRITSPQSEATIRDAQRHVTVEVNAALKPDQGLIYYLDGKAQNSTPTQLTHYELNGVERGTHTLSVAIADANGTPLATSPPLTIYMKPPIARRR